MKMNTKLGKIICVVIALILLAGIIMLFTVGFNKHITYRKGTKIEAKINNGYEKADIEAMANAIRVLGDDPARRQRMSQAALNASLKFDITERAAGILAFMQRKTKKG